MLPFPSGVATPTWTLLAAALSAAHIIIGGETSVKLAVQGDDDLMSPSYVALEQGTAGYCCVLRQHRIGASFSVCHPTG